MAFAVGMVDLGGERGRLPAGREGLGASLACLPPPSPAAQLLASALALLQRARTHTEARARWTTPARHAPCLSPHAQQGPDWDCTREGGRGGTGAEGEARSRPSAGREREREGS
eukprot:3889670-Rhodomonas_salina.1